MDGHDRDSSSRSAPPPPPKPHNAPVRPLPTHLPHRSLTQLAQTPEPSNVLGVFGLSIRTGDNHLYEEFARVARCEKAIVVYDQRVRLASLADSPRRVRLQVESGQD